MALTAEQIDQQRKQAEELLFEGPQKLGFAKALFFGQFQAPLVFPYPLLKPEERPVVEQAVAEVRRFADEHIDAAAIDRNAEIPPDLVAGLGRIGVLGMTAPVEYGGHGFSQLGYTKIMEVIGGHCPSTGVFVNAHHSIGIRALLLFGTEEQKRRWLPPLVSGKQLAAFALTEPEAGSDAANVQTTATPSADGRTYTLSGEKRYITNGAIASVLTVMARTPVPGSSETKVTAFLVTPDMAGFKVLEARMPKCGIRGTATARLAFESMPVPAENILGQVGKGLRVALTVLDFGRTTFGASSVGATKACLKAAIAHAKSRVQFKQPLAEFELVKKKIAFMAAHAFAMEATVSQCASFIDRGADDYMLDCHVESLVDGALWLIVNDTLQIFGGKGYFCDQPYERMMRDARINQIGEGANDVLRSFIAMVGMKSVADQLLGVKTALSNPFRGFGTLMKFGRKQLEARLLTPEIPVQSASLRSDAHELAKSIARFGRSVQSMLVRYREGILERQYVHERVADAGCELYAASCTLSRLDQLLEHGNGRLGEINRDLSAGRYYLRYANRRVRQLLAALTDNDDEMTTQAANAALGR